MSEPSVSERRIRPIQDAIAAANWRQALQQCDKWAKKGEASEQFLALKAFVLVNQSDAPQKERGVSETTRLCTRTPAITEIAALHQIQDTLKLLSLNDEGSKMWDRAVAAKPNDKDLLMTWLKRSISESGWLSAQKATMALRKAFPQERKYDFWNILLCYLINRDTALQEKDRNLFGMLAFRMISKAAEAVPKDKAQLLSSGKAVQTPEELYLLTKIYLSLDHAQEAVKLLQTEGFGLESRFAEQDSQLSMSVLLEALEASQQWVDAFDFCSQLLVEEKYEMFDAVNDDRVWQLLLKSTKALGDASRRTRLLAIISKRLEGSPDLRTVRKAKLFLLQEEADSQDSQAKLLEACQIYYVQFASEGFCFEDLKKPLSRVSDLPLKRFLDQTTTKNSGVGDKVGIDLNRFLSDLKLRYCFVVSSSDDLAVIRDFSAEALRVYLQSTEEGKPLPEACLLAALALVKLGLDSVQGQGNRAQYLVQAIVILAGCCQHYEEYYPALLLLVRLQLLLGMVSSAMMHFGKLSVKNMQWETMGYLILTRISTQHPLQYGKITPSMDAGFNPLEALDMTLEMAENAGRSLSKNIMEGLNYGSYVNVAESVRMKSDMECSLNQRIAATEERRVQRSRGIFESINLPLPPARLVDKRDMSSFADFAISDSPASRHSYCGPLPREMWLWAMTLLDEIYGHLLNALQPQSASGSLPLDSLRKIMSLTSGLDLLKEEELTSAEHYNHKCHRLVAEAVLISSEGSAADQGRLDGIFDKIEAWLDSKTTKYTSRLSQSSQDSEGISPIGDVRTPSWEYLHTNFSKLETLQLLSLFFAVKGKASKSQKTKTPGVSKERVLSLQRLITDVQAKIQADAKKLKDELTAPGVLGKLVDVALFRRESAEPDCVATWIEKLCDAATLETLCGDMRESWEDALDGILAIKIKVFK